MAEKSNLPRRSRPPRDPTDDKQSEKPASAAGSKSHNKGDEKLEGWLKSKELQPPR